MSQRDPNERAVLERALAIVCPMIEALPEADVDVMPPVAKLDDVQVVACGFWLLCGDVTAMLRAAEEAAVAPKESRCAWCVDAAADDDARRAVPALPWEEARAHVQVCEHNPMVAELAKLREECHGRRFDPNLVAERAQLRLALARQMALSDGAVHCEHPTCCATIDIPLVPHSKWVVDVRGWWFCPAHLEEVSDGVTPR